MERKVTSGLMLSLLLVSTLTLACNIQPARATGTIYIRADGSIDPPTANITSTDNVTYTFTNNIYDEIVVQRSKIVVNGADYTVQGTGSGTGIDLSYRNNVTLENVKITNFSLGIYLLSSNNNVLSGNTASNNYVGIQLGDWKDYNGFLHSSNNNLSGNTISNNSNSGIALVHCTNNTVTGNTVSNNGRGIYLYWSSNNVLFHNNFINNTNQAFLIGSSNNMWDGSAGKGNYWSDYEEEYPDAEEIDGSGIWGTPYVIDENNQDNYPLMYQWPPLDTDGDGAPDITDTDDDNDNVNDDEDAFPLDPTESIDTDNDGVGNNADTDDDNDGMPDTWETENGLDPLDAVDASLDPDGDDLTNLEEYQGDTDPNVSDAETFPFWILGATAAVIIGIAVAATFFWRRRK